MSKELYHNRESHSQSEKKCVHESLLPYLLNIPFKYLTGQDALRVCAGDVDGILTDFVQKAREKGLLK